MPLADVLGITIDGAQPRIKHGRLSTLICGKYEENQVTGRPVEGWSPYWGNNTWVDPITGTLMLMPLPLTNAWRNTGTGNYARLTKANLTFVTAASWVDHNTNGDASNYIHCINSALGEVVRTTATYAKNQAFYLSAYAYAADREERLLLTCGWDYANRATTGVSIEIYLSGRIVVKLGNVVEADGKLSPIPGTPARGLWEGWATFIFIPMRRGILIYSQSGGGFFYERSDLDPADNDPTITPAADFWWLGTTGTTVEAAPLKYETSGWRAGVSTYWKDAPVLDQDPESIKVYGEFADTDVVRYLVDRADASTVFIPNGVTKECRVRVALLGDGTTSPKIWAAKATYDAVIVDTNADEKRELINYVSSATLSVPESKRDLSFTFTLKRIQDLDDEDVALGPIQFLETMANRPVLAKIGDMPIFDGIAGAPKIRRSTFRNTDTLTFECAGLWSLLERYRFTDPLPLDGMTLKVALEVLLGSAGIPSDRYDIEDFGVAIDDLAFPSKGEFQVKVSVGDTAATWWGRLFDDYLPDCHWCEKPTADLVTKIVAFSPANAPKLTTPYRIFDDIDRARDYLESEYGASAEELGRLAPARTYRTLDEDTIPAEANTVWVQGLDRRTWRPIVTHDDDDDAMDPTLKPSLRPENWAGTPDVYGLVKESFSSASQCLDATGRLAARLMHPRKMREIEIDMMIDPETLIPLWIGDEVQVHQYRSGELVEEIWRIVSIGGIDFLREFPGFEEANTEAPLVARAARYTLQVIQEGTVAPEGTSMGLGHSLAGSTLREMIANAPYAAAKNWRLSHAQMMPKSMSVPRLSMTENP